MLAPDASVPQIPLMARDDLFEGKRRDADGTAAAYARPMIRSVMNRSDWAIMLALAVIWGGAFMFISVAVHSVHPLT